MKKGFMIAAGILAAVGALLFAAAFIASGSDISKLDSAKYETNTYTVREDYESIEIRSDEADITFKPSEDGKTRVDCVEREKARHEVCVENGTLKIIAADKRAWYDHLTLFSFQPQSVTVYLPSEHFAALTIATETGDIQLAGVRADSIDLSVSTGRIDGKSIDCQETLSVKVSTGKTFLTDVVCKSLISNGSTGSVTLKNVLASDDFIIERDTGDVRFENCDAGQITVKTSTGDVTGTLCSEKVFITKTSTGDTHVPETVSGGRCEITTSTGDISISVKK